MKRLTKRTWAEIDLTALEHNVNEIRRQLPAGCAYLGVVKANAYGHGGVRVAKALEQIGVKHLAVASFDEAAELRYNGITAEILILGPSPVYLTREIVKLGKVCQTIGSLEQAKQMAQQLRGKTLPVHLKLDTGMSRLGFCVHREDGLREAAEAMQLPGLDVQGVFTHFAVSDDPAEDFTHVQYKRFVDAVEYLEQLRGSRIPLRHCTNSGAMVNYPAMYPDMVRPGIVQYGIYPAAERGNLDLKPVMTLKTRVAEITRHCDGDTVSYGRTYTCEEERRFAVLPIGYADGLQRSLSGKLEVLIGGEKAPQRGRICMDMCMVDITHLPHVQIGDEVEIFGCGQNVSELAALAGTIPYELLCGVSPRVPRVYSGEGTD